MSGLDTPKRARRRFRVRWPDAPVRMKLTLLVLLAAVCGAGLGMIEAGLGHRGWPLLLGLAALAGAVLSLGIPGLCEPTEQLLRAAKRARESRRPMRPAELESQRGDEFGRLITLIHELSAEAYRQSTVANQLRRTLDHRVAESTKRATQQLHELANRDAMTGLANRRFLNENLEPLVRSCLESRTELLCILIDMDRFKQINDTLGHQTGDRLIVFLAQLIRGQVRRSDYAVRLGGDEFAVFMPGANLDRARHFVDRLMNLFTQHTRTTFPKHLQAGLSIGIASLLGDGLQSGQDLLERADAHLYTAKRRGRNRVVVAESCPA
jgi:diguanylate cyclase (GGDEF)-like protein